MGFVSSTTREEEELLRAAIKSSNPMGPLDDIREIFVYKVMDPAGREIRARFDDGCMASVYWSAMDMINAPSKEQLVLKMLHSLRAAHRPFHPVELEPGEVPW